MDFDKMNIINYFKIQGGDFITFLKNTHKNKACFYVLIPIWKTKRCPSWALKRDVSLKGIGAIGYLELPQHVFELDEYEIHKIFVEKKFNTIVFWSSTFFHPHTTFRGTFIRVLRAPKYIYGSHI